MSRETISNKQIVAQLAKKLNITHKQSSTILDAYYEILQDNLKTEKPVLIGKVLRVTLKSRGAVIRRNPQTGEKVECAPKKYLRAALSSDLKEDLNNG